MVAATLRDKSITPKEAAAWAVDKGYRTYNSGTKWAYFPAYFQALDVSCTATASGGAAEEALRAGKMVIASAAKGIWTASGHFILAWGIDPKTGKVLIHDPNSEASYRELADPETFRAQTVQYWIVEEKMEDEDMAVRYAKLSDMPAWARPVISELMAQGILRGDGAGLDLSEDMVRILVLVKRMLDAKK